MDADKYFKDGRVYIWKGLFDIVKARKPMPGAFTTIKDKEEVTVIIEESRMVAEDVVAVEKGWKILTFDMILPFGLVGFLAKVSQVLADENIPIFAISAYSTDHLLVKEGDLDKAVEKLESLGCNVETR